MVKLDVIILWIEANGKLPPSKVLMIAVIALIPDPGTIYFGIWDMRCRAADGRGGSDGSICYIAINVSKDRIILLYF